MAELESYCTIEEASEFYSEDEIFQLFKESDESLNNKAFNRSLRSASSEIDVRLSKVITTPLFLEYEIIPEIIKEWTAIIALYKRSNELGAYTDEKRRRYDDVIATLKDIVAGKANLPDEGRKVSSDADNKEDYCSKYDAEFNSEQRIFTRESMKGL